MNKDQEPLIRREPALTIGAVLSLVIVALQAALGIADSGGFEDGIQFAELGVIFTPIVSGLLIRFGVYSPASHDEEVRAASHGSGSRR